MFTFGERAAFVDTYATSLLLKYGDVIRCDVGCSFKGYKSDLSRTAVMGKPNDKIRKYYESVLVGQKKAIMSIKPGVEVSQLFQNAMEGTKSAGLSHYSRVHCGHGIGLEVYEPPVIKNTDRTVLKTGMVICVETPYYELGWGGVQVEDMVMVTDEGYRLLSKCGSSLLVLD